MKNRLIKCCVVLAACTVIQTNSGAQTYIAPTMPDIPWYTSQCLPGPGAGVYIAGLNTAMIENAGTPQSPKGPPVNPSTLMVSNFYGNGTAGGVSFRDEQSTFTTTFNYCNAPFAPNYFANSPDIIVGNDFGAPLTNYRVASAYINLATGTPQIDYFLVSYFATGVFNVTWTGSTTFNPIWAAGTIHLDIIANSANTGLTGMPFCNRFIITWDDFNTGMCYSTIASLNAPPGVINPGPTVIALNNGAGGPATMPDVAAIRRTVGATNDRVGLYVTVENNSVYYQEYDWSLGVFLTGPILLGGPYPNGVIWPRIDAPDDPAINNPTTPGLCYFKAVAQVYTGGGAVASFAYDNQPFGAGLNDGWYMGPAAWGPYSPTVAYGGTGGTQYQVSHIVDAFGGLPTAKVFMEPLDWMLPFSAVAPDNNVAIQPYFGVNTFPFNFANGNYLNAISTPCNAPANKTLCAWSDNLPGGPMGPYSQVYYKVSPAGAGGFLGYAFKHAAPNEVPLTTEDKWEIYPNPATNELNVENTATGKYIITDMVGRTVLNGELHAGLQQLDISSLAKGSYIITSYSDGQQKYHSNFVKQ